MFTEQDVPLAIEDISPIEQLAISASVLWESWPRDMHIRFSDFANKQRFSLVGTCPHCGIPSNFIMPHGTIPYAETRNHESDNGFYPRQHLFAMLECSACYEFILGVIVQFANRWEYKAHYPLGKPNDKIPIEIQEVSPEIASDFREALRCRHVDAYNATVKMCHRALEASCIQQGAPEELVLQKMIDWVAKQGKITEPLREMAHKVRLGGDRGAHPSSRVITDKDADAVIEFTREYFAHVYVMPAKMGKFDFSKPKPEKKTEAKSGE